MKDIFEIVLRTQRGSDYCSFKIDAYTDLHELLETIYDMVSSHFDLEEASKI